MRNIWGCPLYRTVTHIIVSKRHSTGKSQMEFLKLIFLILICWVRHFCKAEGRGLTSFLLAIWLRGQQKGEMVCVRSACLLPQYSIKVTEEININSWRWLPKAIKSLIPFLHAPLSKKKRSVFSWLGMFRRNKLCKVLPRASYTLIENWWNKIVLSWMCVCVSSFLQTIVSS